jgi:hypothetical protein
MENAYTSLTELVFRSCKQALPSPTALAALWSDPWYYLDSTLHAFCGICFRIGGADDNV